MTTYQYGDQGSEPTKPDESQAEPLADEGKSEVDPADVQRVWEDVADVVGPFDIVAEEFHSYNGGLSIIALCADEQGHETEYSVSYDWGFNEYEEVVADNETDDEFKARLHAAVIREINDPKRAILIANRFKSTEQVI